MKKVLKFTTVVAFMFVTVISKADDFKSSLATTENGKNLIFKLDAASEETKIKLVDNNGILIYSEDISGQIGYFKKFNLNNLEKGIYSMKIEDSMTVIMYTISLSDTDIRIIERKENTKPVFRKKGEMVFLNLLNLEKEDVQIKVYDSANRIVFSERLKNDMIVEKAFNFANAYKDTYTVMVKNSNDVYYEHIVIK